MLMEFQTKLLHGKAVDNYANGSTVPPISLANAFAYESSEQLEKVFQNRAPGFAYTRIANPTVDASLILLPAAMSLPVRRHRLP